MTPAEPTRRPGRGASGFESMPVGRGAFAPDPLPRSRAGGFRRAGEPEPAVAPAAPPGAPAAPPPDLEAIRRAAYEDGERAGRAALPWQEAEALRHAACALASALDGLAALRGRYLLENRRTVVELACAIAERVLGAPAVERDAIVALVDRAVALFPAEEALTLHLSPADHEVLAASPDALLGRLTSGAGRIAVVADPALAPGAVRLAGASGDVRAVVAEVLAQLRAELGDAVAAGLPPVAAETGPAADGEGAS
jgi:flagellar biosynthesis/type III secretory pathway protein FliH